MLSLRNTTLVDPSNPRVCVSELGSRLGMGSPICVRALAEHRDRSLVKRWCVCLISYQNSGEPAPSGIPRALDRGPMPADWFEGVFYQLDGLAAYFRQMSGGRLLIEWEVFTLPELLTIGEKVVLAQSGGEAEWYRQALAATNPAVNIDDFDYFMWLPNEGASRGGVDAGIHVFVGVVDFVPQTAMQEMAHAVGMTYHADRQKLDDYGDSFCVLGNGRGFESTSVSFKDANLGHNSTHARTGPGMCAPYLYQAGWLTSAYMWQFAPEELGELADINLELDANQGAPRSGTGKIALTIGGFPLTTADPAQYWVEYRHPSGFDRSIHRPSPTAQPNFPPEGVILLRKVVLRDAPHGSGVHSLLVEAKGASPGNRLQLPSLGYSIRVTSVDANKRRLSLTVDRA